MGDDCFDTDSSEFGQSVEDGTEVVRFCSQSKTGFAYGATQPPLSAFDMASRDKEGSIPHLSVWAPERTKMEHARARLPEDVQFSAYRATSCGVRACRVDDFEGFSLDVVHTPLRPDGYPSPDGHCGITNMPLEHPEASKKQLKRMRKDLRSELVKHFVLIRSDL